MLDTTANDRLADTCVIDHTFKKDDFLRDLISRPPVELPDTTPIYSNAAFQLLAFALESKGTPFSSLIGERVLDPLQMNNSAFLQQDPISTAEKLKSNAIIGEPAALGLTSTITDLSAFGRAMLTSELISSAETRRWLKPVTDTSNLRNAVGRPWDIYHFGTHNTVVDIYTKSGNVGRYSSYFGLAPAYDVGFAILAVNSEGQAPDLNAYADITLGGLLQVDALGRAEASETLAGKYKSSDSDSILEVEVTDSDPGIVITTLTVNGSNWLAKLAKLAGIDKTKFLDLRMYPTNLEQSVDDGGKQQVFQGVIQDKSALADAGTSTCVSWQTVGKLNKNGEPLDRFLIEFNKRGVAKAVVWPGMGVRYERAS